MVFYFLSPIGKKSDFLFDTFEKTFISLGHTITERIEEANFVFYDLWCGWGEYDNEVVDTIIRKRISVSVMDFFDYSGSVHWHGWHNWDAVKHQQWAFILKEFIGLGIVKTYFMRKMHKYLKYPEYVHPIECVQYPDHIFPLVSKDELFNRPNDIFFIGNSSPERESVCNELSKHFKCDFVLGQERIPHDEWLNRARNAKMFLTADGGGFSDERAYQLIDIAVMVKQKNNHFQKDLWYDNINCLLVRKEPLCLEIDTLRLHLKKKDRLYYIYKNGRIYMKENYSAVSRAHYVLNTILQTI